MRAGVGWPGAFYTGGGQVYHGPRGGGSGVDKPCLSLSRPLQVQFQQPRQNFIIAQIGRAAISGEDRLVQLAMRVLQPRWILIVEIGQRALLQCHVNRCR